MASTDRDALLDLFHSTGGANWRKNGNWGTDEELSAWHGVGVNDEGRVVKIDLGNNLEGQIPPQLGDLGALEYLSLSNNELEGPIPSELGYLSALKELQLWGNQLSGSIPPELGGLSKLETLSLENNKLTGLPRQLGDLGALKSLDLSNNELERPIPPELGNLTALQSLALDDNGLSGEIPALLGQLRNLQELYLYNNKLAGSIPKELGDLRELRELSLGSNRLTGTIPAQLVALNKLEWLDLSNNQLSGPIPPELGNLTALRRLGLDDNGLSGPTPKELGALSELQSLRLQGNQLSGHIPPQLGDLGALETLDLSRNNLDGPIPAELGMLTKLEHLWLQHNNLTAFWDCRRDFEGGDELQQRFAGELSIPKQLDILLAFFTTLGGNLVLSGNPWKEPPEAVVGKGMQAVKEYFADLFAEGVSDRRNMIKVVLVGQEGAGKTSIRQSIRNRKPHPTSGSEESTVHIDVEEMKMDIDGVSLRVYDCAGQVAYTGLLQMFLTPRAMTLLMCNTEAFGQRHGSVNSDPLQQDLSKLQELRVCDWLRSLSFRIPDSDVIVVATKCDRAPGMAVALAERMERAIRKWLEIWSDSQMTAVRVEDGLSLTSCVASAVDEREGAALGKRKHSRESMWTCDWREDTRDEPLPNLLHRVIYNSKGNIRGAALVLPRSWSIALAVLDALGNGRDPVKSVHQMKLAADGRPGGGNGVVSITTKQQRGIEGLTMAELLAKWGNVVQTLKGDKVEVVNPDHALEGALSIREHEGSLVRHEIYVFLDVTWLAKILKPLLNHRDTEDFDGSLSLGDTGITLEGDAHISSWSRFKENGILEMTLARVLWPDGLSDYVLPTLESLGLAHPIDGDPAQRLVVLVRLGEERPPDVGEELDDFRRDHTAVLNVTWKVFMGVPPGSIEKVLVRCSTIGALRTFWRFGVLVQGCLGGGGVASKTFALLVEYTHERNEIDMRVYGNIGTAAPWAALSLGISAVRTMCLDFPGLRWRASLKCPQHQQANMPITNKATRPGDKLILEKTCRHCSSETGGLGAAAMDLLLMIDTLQSKGEIFREIHGRFVKLQLRYPLLRPEGSQGLCPEQAQVRFDAWLSGVKEEIEGLLLDGVEVSTDEVSALRQSVGDLHQRIMGQHQDVRGLIEAEFKSLWNAIHADDGVMGRLDFVVAMLMGVRREGVDIPRYACVLPPWEFANAHGLSEREQKPEVWVKRLEEWQVDDFKEGTGLFKKEKRLFLVCAHTHRLVPCGTNGQGYDIQQPRTWFKNAVSVAAFALQMMFATLGAMLATPLAVGGAVADATVSAAMEHVESLLQDHMKRLTLDDCEAELGEAPKTVQLEGHAYASLREFIHEVQHTAGLEMLKATMKAHKDRRAPPSASKFVYFAQKMVQVQKRDGDAAVQWVLREYEEAWYNANRPVPVA